MSEALGHKRSPGAVSDVLANMLSGLDYWFLPYKTSVVPLVQVCAGFTALVLRSARVFGFAPSSRSIC